MNENPVAIPGAGSGSAELVSADISLSPAGQRFLNQTRPWVRFMSVMMFIGAAFMVLMGLLMVVMGIGTGAMSVSQGRLGGLMNALGPAIAGVFYMILALLYIAPGVFLSRYASSIKLLETSRSGQALQDALKHQKSFWRYIGIATLIGLILAAVAIFASIFIVAMVAQR